jgi:uncharacterized protein
MSDTVPMPIPSPSPATQPFWDAAQEGRLIMPRCPQCGIYQFPPTLACNECGCDRMEWVPVSGRGSVFSFVVYHRVYHPAFADKVPYVVAVIELEEGPRIISNVVGIAPSEVTCDMPVRVVFEAVRDGYQIPKFEPAA